MSDTEAKQRRLKELRLKQLRAKAEMSEGGEEDEFAQRYEQEAEAPGASTGLRAFTGKALETLPFIGTYMPEISAVNKLPELLMKDGSLKQNFGKEADYQRYLLNRLGEEEALPSAAGTGVGVAGNLATGVGAVGQALKTAPSWLRLLAGSGLAGVEGAVDNPKYYGAEDYADLEGRTKRGIFSSALAGGLSVVGQGLQKAFGGKDAANRFALSSVFPDEQTKKQIETIHNTTQEQAGKILRDTGALKGNAPRKEILKTIGSSIEEKTKSLRDMEATAQRNMAKYSTASGAKKYGIDKNKVVERIQKYLAVDPESMPDDQIKYYNKRIREFMISDPEMTFDRARELRAKSQRAVSHAATDSPGSTKKLFEDAKARALNDSLDETMEMFAGPDTARKYSDARKQIGVLLELKDAAGDRVRKDSTGILTRAFQSNYLPYMLGGAGAGATSYMDDGSGDSWPIWLGLGALSAQQAYKRGPQMMSNALAADIVPPARTMMSINPKFLFQQENE